MSKTKTQYLIILISLVFVSSSVKIDLSRKTSELSSKDVLNIFKEFRKFKSLDQYVKHNKSNSKFLGKNKENLKKLWNMYNQRIKRVESISSNDIISTSYGGYFYPYYYANINIGTPAQSFQLILDTGSSDLWATNYDPTQSSTFVNLNTPYNRSYGQGTDGSTSISGYLGTDVVTFGSFTLNNYRIGVIQDNSSSLSGLIGLSTIYISLTGATPLIQEFYNQGFIEKPIFSFYLNENSGAALILGQVDSSYYTGEINYVNLNIKSWWEFEIQGIELYGQLLPYSYAFFDTGTPDTLLFPNEYGSNFENVLNNGSGSPEASVVIGNQNYRIPEDLLSSYDNAAINFIVLGSPFLELYYTVYDYENYRVGIANLNPNLS